MTVDFTNKVQSFRPVREFVAPARPIRLSILAALPLQTGRVGEAGDWTSWVASYFSKDSTHWMDVMGLTAAKRARRPTKNESLIP